MNLDQPIQEAIELLQSLIRVQSYSGEENETASIIQTYLNQKGILTERIHNNIIARSRKFTTSRPTIILNSHHDTVQIGNGWTKDPLGGEIKNGRLYGRGSNDAGGCLVSLIATFITLHDVELPHNLMLIASGEEENFGANGVSSVLSQLEFEPTLGIIGEPTEMHLAIAEKGLVVIDAEVKGITGHAARDLGENAIHKAQKDIQTIHELEWDRVSSVLGKTKSTITQVNAGSQHNVIPDLCTYVIDCRVNEKYELQEILDQLSVITVADLKPRSLRWHPSGIDRNHPVVQKGITMGRNVFGSPTLSDQVHFKCPTIKMGPGKSERSHTVDEYIEVIEIEAGIQTYLRLLEGLSL